MHTKTKTTGVRRDEGGAQNMMTPEKERQPLERPLTDESFFEGIQQLEEAIRCMSDITDAIDRLTEQVEKLRNELP